MITRKHLSNAIKQDAVRIKKAFMRTLASVAKIILRIYYHNAAKGIGKKNRKNGLTSLKIISRDSQKTAKKKQKRPQIPITRLTLINKISSSKSSLWSSNSNSSLSNPKKQCFSTSQLRSLNATRESSLSCLSKSKTRWISPGKKAALLGWLIET